jgi:hypothetical protein
VPRQVILQKEYILVELSKWDLLLFSRGGT